MVKNIEYIIDYHNKFGLIQDLKKFNDSIQPLNGMAIMDIFEPLKDLSKKYGIPESDMLINFKTYRKEIISNSDYILH